MTKISHLDILRRIFILIDELVMYISRIKIRKILLSGSRILLLFLAFLYSDNTMIGFSEFGFLSGNEQINTVSFDITWGFTTGFTIIIENKEQTWITYKLEFVDASITNDSFTNKTCLSPNQDQIVWKYITGDTSPFTLPAGATWTKTISVTFPNTYNGLYHGCITLNAITNDQNGYTNTLPTRWIFLDANVHSNIFSFIVKAYPSNRVYQSTNNANKWVIKIYNTNKQFVASSTEFELDSDGYGTWEITLTPWTYYAVFKWQSHLASYLSWITFTGSWDILDFTTGSNLYGAQTLDPLTDNGWRYQTAWDLKNIDGEYDFVINGNDISIILFGTFPQWAGVLDPRNLNGDTMINASDISIIGANCLKQDAFATIGGIFTW